MRGNLPTEQKMLVVLMATLPRENDEMTRSEQYFDF